MSVRSAIAWLCAAATAAGSFAAARSEHAIGASPAQVAAGAPAQNGCLRCHEGIEEMHPAADLSCTDCHGGDASATSRDDAHVPAPRGANADERVADLERDLAWRRFRNPMDLRVARTTCGGCHAAQVASVRTSLHGTTAGHLSDGFYEVGLLEERASPYGVFPLELSARDGGGKLVQVPAFRASAGKDSLAAHYSDLPRKECMQCHLYSEGRAVRGRVGFDGDYRGSGCAACHVPYSLTGLSESADRSAVRTEPGHPQRHAMTRAPTTQTCTSCHYGDASIGLAFRGLSQLPPGAPGGPDVPGTTDVLLNRAFYLNDAALCPPDVHHERGMHCVDCHTANDLMGDGQLHEKMEHAVEISCTACHGTFSSPSTLRTERGTPLEHLRRVGDGVVLTSKVTGREHVVPQVVHVLDPLHPEYDADAARAMTPEHERIECYTCHAGWNVNFLGFHFDRNASLSQLDLLSGERTPGRVTTQEKVFATWKSFYAGWNERGALAPYMTGFATMGSVTDADGERVLDQVLPVTAEGLSGMSMIHHQTHTVRPTARGCVECHRAPATFGLGSVNFRLGRQLAFVAERRGLEVVALDRGQLASSVPLAKLVLPGVVDLELLDDPLQGFARFVFAAERDRGVHVIDVRDPAHPKRVGFVASIAPQGLALAGDYLYCADGPGGLVVYDVGEPQRLRRVASVPTFDARALHVQWPFAYVADGPGGLAIFDVRAAVAPRLVSSISLGGAGAEGDAAVAVSVLFQYSRPLAGREGEPLDERAPARNLCAVLDEREGLVLVDVTEPTRPRILRAAGEPGATRAANEARYSGLALASHVDPAELQGGRRTAERDYAYVLRERRQRNGEARTELQVFDLDEPERPRRVSALAAGEATAGLALGWYYNAPFLRTLLFAPGSLGVSVIDASLSNEPAALGLLPALPSASAIELEAFPLDRMRDAAGRPLKDVSHEGSRWLNRAEIERVLDVSATRLGLAGEGEEAPDAAGSTARLLFADLDLDASGFLEGDEARGALASAADADGDGLVTLLEIADYGQTLRAGAASTEPAKGEANPAAPEVAPPDRAGPDGELALLLDGLDPARFDRNRDALLDRGEAERAFFAALDLDGDGGLSRDELSRHPGEARRLRFPGPGAERLFGSFDRSLDGRVGPQEFSLRDEDWLALDRDRDGKVALASRPAAPERGNTPPPLGPEWPSRRASALPLPPTLAPGALEARLDRDGDGELLGAELRGRRDLLDALDQDRNARIDAVEIQEAIARLAAAGVDACADGFEARWDLDRDGRVDEEEIPLPVGARARVLGKR